MRRLAIALTALSLGGIGVLAGCGSDDDRSATVPQTVEQSQTTGTLSEDERARALGRLVEKAREADAREEQRNLEKFQKGERTCPEGQGYNAQLDFCL